MKTRDDLIDDIFIREGDRYSEPPQNDQPTGRGGITLPTYQKFCDAMQPGRRVTTLDLQALSHDEARGIVGWFLDELAREMGLSQLTSQPLQLQMLDFGYNSGGPRAIRWLQRCLNVARSGHMDMATVMAANNAPFLLLNQALVAARLQMIGSMTDTPEARSREHGLNTRALSFSLLQVP